MRTSWPSEQREARVQIRGRYPDARGLRRQLPLRTSDVGTLAHQIGRHSDEDLIGRTGNRPVALHRRAVHTEVWERIRNDQSEPEDGVTDRSWRHLRDILSRGVVVNIEMYVMSIQTEKE